MPPPIRPWRRSVPAILPGSSDKRGEIGDIFFNGRKSEEVFRPQALKGLLDWIAVPLILAVLPQELVHAAFFGGAGDDRGEQGRKVNPYLMTIGNPCKEVGGHPLLLEDFSATMEPWLWPSDERSEESWLRETLWVYPGVHETDSMVISMMTTFRRLLLGTFLLLLPVELLTAQKVWLVDSAGGGHFKTLSAAVQTAKNGDTILIQGRSAPYGAVSTAKALALRGIDKPWIQSVTVKGLPKGSVFSIRGLVLETGSLPPLAFVNNRGTIHCEDLVVTGRNLGLFQSACLVSSSSLVTFNACRFQIKRSSASLFPAMSLEIRASVVTLSACVSQGTTAGAWAFGINRSQPALWARNSRIVISGGNYSGGNGGHWSRFGQNKIEKASPAVDILGGSLLIEDSGRAILSGGTPDPGDTRGQPAILASKTTVTIDPRVILVSPKSKTNVKGATPIMRKLPGLTAFGAQSGSVVQTIRHGAPGNWTGLILGVPSSPRMTPFGDLWLQPILYVDLGRIPMSGMRRLNLAIPRRGVPFGIRLGLQSFQLQGSRLELSPPVIVIIN